MANRFIKSSIWTSPNLNSLSDQAELLFYRLLPLPDDHGCFDADPRVLKGLLFPIKDSWTVEIIGNQLLAIKNSGLITLWMADNRLYGIFNNWDKHQSIRSKFKRKTPEPPEKSNTLDAHKLLQDIVINCNQLKSVVASPPSSLLSPPSPLPSSLNDIPAGTNPPDSGKPTDGSTKKDPTRDYILEAIVDEIKSKLNAKCPYPLAGKIIQLAGWKVGESYPWGLYGHIMVCIGRVSHWVTEKAFIGAITKDLKRRHVDWPDNDRQLIKAFENKFEAWIKSEFPQKMDFKIGE